MFNFVSLLKYKRQMTGNTLCKPAQRMSKYARSRDIYICQNSKQVSPINDNRLNRKWQNTTSSVKILVQKCKTVKSKQFSKNNELMEYKAVNSKKSMSK